MSNIYIQEPVTNGKVILKTSLGDIDIELWPREAPKACRNFTQLCLEGYYNDNIFHRVVKGFIAQTGDPTGTGYGGESIYGEPFKDEFHSRLRFIRRGLVAMANSEKDSNGSQFFFTLGSCAELQNKHTIFGKVTGNTLYNMIKLEELQVDQNERPLYPAKIVAAQVVHNPFPDIVPRKTSTKKEDRKEERPKVKGTKDYKLLSFGDEAEEEEEEINAVSKEFRGKSKSSHDLLKNDPKLSSEPAVDPSLAAVNNRRLKGDVKDDDEEDSGAEDDDDKRERSKNKLDKIKDKFKRKSLNDEAIELNIDEEDVDEDRDNPDSKKLTELRQEIQSLKKGMKKDKKDKKKTIEDKLETSSANPLVEELRTQVAKYKTGIPPPKGNDRVAKTLEMWEKFKSKIQKTKDKLKHSDKPEEDKPIGDAGEDDDTWLARGIQSQKEEGKLAKDANIRNEEDWFDIYDPRNPINKRRRDAGLEVEGPSKKKPHS